MKISFSSYLLLFCIACNTLVGNADNATNTISTEKSEPGFETIGAIALPPGYSRIKVAPNSFAAWLRNVSLKESSTVYLYNGAKKPNQSAQFAVLNIPVGNKDLQQCADAVMRLRAEFLFNKQRYNEIVFYDNAGKPYAWKNGADKSGFDKYLERVFGMCGTASLEKQLKKTSMNAIQPGDVLIKGGFPGHAMMVVDVAINHKGEKIYMLAQSYMPAQDIHVVKNPENDNLNPWYQVSDNAEINTPEWTFATNQLKSWQ